MVEAAIRTPNRSAISSTRRNQPALALTVASGLLGATVADLFMPVFSGHLVDALTRGAAEPAARHAALSAFGAIVALGLLSTILRFTGLRAIVPFTLRIMFDVACDAFMRVQRFSTDWHANSFAGSTVRKITRGMWALDLLNDTILMALLPSLVVLLGLPRYYFHLEGRLGSADEDCEEDSDDAEKNIWFPYSGARSMPRGDSRGGARRAPTHLDRDSEVKCRTQ
jgi:ABC-type multidrug transport system fused ATPase/permease subunit